MPLKEAATIAGKTPKTLRNWMAAGHLTRHEGPPARSGKPRLLVSLSELQARLSPPEEKPTDTEEEERTLADELREDLRVAQKVVDAIERQLDEGEGIPGRTIMALGTLIKTTSALKERIAVLDAQRPKGPQDEDEALQLLRLSMEGWDDRALEMAFEVYRQRHTSPMQERVCLLTVSDGQGHEAVWTADGWEPVAA